MSREKCQKCAKPATYHITEIERGKPREFHFCDEHARQYVAPSDEAAESTQAVGKMAKELVSSPADQHVCPVCQTTFLDFRNSGRLGCPHDYEVFRDELMPLLETIHDETRHSGKVPRRAPMVSRRQTELIDLRNQLKRAIASEKYEEAAKVRDQIRIIEQEQGR